MTVEAGRGAMREERDEFPVGMRVLAVDDDPTCLKVLDAMLRQCKYHVTTTNQAIKALRMLRENKYRFDLIITDVHMPDMDGFKLLELVGLEMDLPVIMLSANGDTKVVMKGITHGACDYLLKPVRMEELKNIWQHVVRKKKSVPREHNNSDNGNSAIEGQGPITSGSSEHKLNRKRKDQNEEEDDDNEDNTNENENTSSQKKARVVWSVELHRKFMVAVNHLGINKAVPKKILDFMNVEGLTRENVASHLQKYRLYLKKVVNQEANLVNALGVRESYLPLPALDSFADFHSFTTSSQLPAVASFPKNGGLSRKDPPVLGYNIISHGIAQTGHTQNGSNPIGDLSKLQHVTGSQNGNYLQSMPSALGIDQLQQKRMMRDSNNRFSGSFPAVGLGTGGFTNPIGTETNNPMTVQATSIGLGSICSVPFEVNVGVSSNLPDPVRFNETWQSAMPSNGTTSDLPMSSGVSPVVSQINCNPLSFSSSSSLVVPAIGNTMLMLKGTIEDPKYLNFGSVGSTQQQWREAKENHTHEPNIVFTSSLNPSLAGQSVVDSNSHSQIFNNGMRSKRVVTNMNGQSNHSTMFLPQQCKIDKSNVDGQLNYKDAYSLENSTLQGGFISNGYNFDELVNMIKSVLKLKRASQQLRRTHQYMQFLIIIFIILLVYILPFMNRWDWKYALTA